MNLIQIEPGETAIVETVVGEDGVSRRLRDLGLVPGVEITCVGRSPFGDPSAYLILGSIFALRRQDCGGVVVRRRG